MHRTSPVLLLSLLACATGPEGRPDESARGIAGRPELPARPSAWASREFWAHWGDGRAELTGYRGTVSRYGELREAEIALIYVTEPLDRRTLVKDDDAPREQRLSVIKLNQSVKFMTGIYPYSVLTSVFAPVDGYFAERFTPAKITMSAQEWCGHVFQGVWPGRDRFLSHVLSYFATEGEGSETVETPENTVYEDGLMIQLRELDGPFAGGRDWEGPLIPALWRNRRAHVDLRPEHAVIRRAEASRDGTPVTRFTIEQGDYRRTIDVERAAPRRILGWSVNDGEEVTLLRTARLPYWELHGNEHTRHRADIGLTDLAPPPAPPPLPETAAP